MQLAVTSPSARAPRHPAPAHDVPTSERAGGGVQGFIGDAIRGGVAGYQAATNQSGVQVDKAAIHPFETVTTATGLIKSKTAGIKYVNKATGLLHTVGGFGMLILSSNLSATMRAPGNVAVDLGNRLADLIDGKTTAAGSSLGWGVSTDAETGQQIVAESGVGSALSALGMR